MQLYSRIPRAAALPSAIAASSPTGKASPVCGTVEVTAVGVCAGAGETSVAVVTFCVGKLEGEAITTGLGVGVAITMGRGVGVRTNTLFWKIMLVTVSSVILPV